MKILGISALYHDSAAALVVDQLRHEPVYRRAPHLRRLVHLRNPAMLHDRAAFPSMITVHAPHCERPQPNLGPFSPKSSRKT